MASKASEYSSSATAKAVPATRRHEMDPFIGIQTANRSSKQGRAIQRWRPGLEGDTWTVTDTAGSSIEGGDEWRAVGVGREPKGEMER
jgi:hypothetical protein